MENTTNQQVTTILLEQLPKDMIQTHFVQHLSQGSRGPSTRVETWELVNAIVYKLKTGVQLLTTTKRVPPNAIKSVPLEKVKLASQTEAACIEWICTLQFKPY